MIQEMSIFETIKLHHLKARKEGNKATASVLSVVIGSLENKANINKDGVKFVDDDVAISVLKSILKNINEFIVLAEKETSNIETSVIEKLKNEKSIIESFLPVKLTEDELREIISEFIAFNEKSKHTIKDIMTFLRTTYTNLYDGKTASDIVNELLKHK